VEPPERRRPPTVADIARRAGVSTAAVSYALSGRPGVAAHTRRRIRAVAEEMGWVPHPAARALHGHGVGVVGFVVAGPERLFGVDTYHFRLASGMMRELSAHSYDVVLHEAAGVHEAAALYRRWHAERRVDAVFLSTLRYDDPRIEVLNELGMPAVVYSGPDVGDLAWIGHRKSDRPAMAETVDYLVGLGHGRLAYVSGPLDMRYVTDRVDAFTRACRSHAVEQSTVVTGDDRGDQAARITRRLLSRPGRPTAVIYNNDIMALAGLAVTTELGLDVPDDLSIVSWEDSSLLRLTHPPVATVSREVASRGGRAGQALLALLAGEPMKGALLDPVWLLPDRSVGRPGARSAS
jgi:DNA-binding LacI/PurR family transcriptional regulator